MTDHALWVRQLLEELEESCEVGAETVRYLREKHVRVSVHRQHTGARWTLIQGIQINPQYTKAATQSSYTLSLIVHETQHVRQGLLTALSVYGELEAWQMQFGFLRRLDGSCPGTAEQSRLIDQLLSLPLGWERTVLRTARGLMKQYAGKRYHVELEPLYPIHHELIFRITHRHPA
jgi:hypothetical protein